MENCYLSLEELEKIKESFPDEVVLEGVSDLFKIFGDKTRVRILYALFNQELCVQDIAKILDMSQSAISHQLRTLRTARLVKFRRDGKTVVYSLADDHVVTIFNQGLEHVEE